MSAWFGLAGCARSRSPGGESAATTTTTTSFAIRDQATFLQALSSRGVSTEVLGPIEQPFFGRRGSRLRVSGGPVASPTELQVFEYMSFEQASSDAGVLDPQGNPRTMQVEWTAQPHFYHRSKIIVLYVGTDASIQSLLTEMLGPPFAGGEQREPVSRAGSSDRVPANCDFVFQGRCHATAAAACAAAGCAPDECLVMESHPAQVSCSTHR